MNIDWFITNRCDQASHCLFCNAPWNAFPKDVSLERAYEICNRLAEIGTTSVTLCGGEPFMYPCLETVVRWLSERKIKVILYTSATSSKADIDKMLPNIYFLSLPVDAVSPKVVLKMRGESQFIRVSALLNRLKNWPSLPHVKIGTVVTQLNIKDLENILNFLHRLVYITVWRLYQFSPYGIGGHHQKEFIVTGDDFRAEVTRIKLLNKSLGSKIHIAERSREDMFGYCMIMDSGGSFWRYEECYVPLGVSVFQDVETIVKHYDQEKHAQQKAWHSRT